jgi:hypothetical protein
MNTATTTGAENMSSTAEAFTAMVNEMIASRRSFAEENGFIATDEEIADHIKNSLVRMMKQASK